MKQLKVLAVAVALCLSSTFAMGEDVKSGLEPGAAIGPFYVTKAAGAEKDSVEVGKNLCYRCKNGSRPQVMVFTRSSDAKVVDLVKSLDAQIEKNSDKKLTAFVNYLSDSKESAEESAKKLAAESKATAVPFVVPNEFENGPEDYGINSKAEVTIVFAVKGKVEANVAVASAKEIDLEKINEALAKILE